MQITTKRILLEQEARGEGCLGRAHDDEPVFLLRARDMLAPSTVVDWANRLLTVKIQSKKADDALKIAAAMREWAHLNGGNKIPD